jgi:hypothetical protein
MIDVIQKLSYENFIAKQGALNSVLDPGPHQLKRSDPAASRKNENSYLRIRIKKVWMEMDLQHCFPL